MKMRKPECDWDCFNCKFPDCIRNGCEIPKGLCKNCRIRPAVPGYTCCEVCREKDSKRLKTLREQRKAAGVCAQCGKRPPAPGLVTCEQCLERERTRVRLARMKKKGGGTQ